VGFPGIIAHGMFTMAHLTTCLAQWLGDPTALRRIRVQFRAVVFMDEAIVAGGRVTELDPATKTAKLDVWVTIDRAGVTEYPIKRSTAEVELGWADASTRRAPRAGRGPALRLSCQFLLARNLPTGNAV
jgi:acyl dehydratase